MQLFAHNGAPGVIGGKCTVSNRHDGPAGAFERICAAPHICSDDCHTPLLAARPQEPGASTTAIRPWTHVPGWPSLRQNHGLVATSLQPPRPGP